jgi:Na+:H+ antiporter, NhaA family
VCREAWSASSFRDQENQMAQRFQTRITDFLRTETAGAKLLLGSALIALAVANSPLGDSYRSMWDLDLPFDALPDLRHLVNDGLMTLFFLVVGLEIRRELDGGELASPRAALLPVIGAVGGMVVPALIYAAFNAGGSGAAGWGIPTATDIAFAVGVVSLFAHRIPVGAKVFLLSLAIVDDIGAIIVIAVFYASEVHPGWLAVGAVIAAALGMTRWLALPTALVWLGGFLLWLALLGSGIHPTIAGVVLAAVIPRALAERADDVLHLWSSLIVVPLFALANAGIVLNGDSIGDALASPVGIGIVIALVIGKLAGIFTFAYIAVRARVAVLPEGATWSLMIALAAVAGIGFTVSLFVTELAFDSPALLERARVGVVVGSVAAAVIGGSLLHLATRGRDVQEAP